MCFLIAKKFNKKGSLAFQIEHGKKLASLSSYLTLASLEHDVQIITLNNLDAYKKYAPYTVITDEDDFIDKVINI